MLKKYTIIIAFISLTAVSVNFAQNPGIDIKFSSTNIALNEPFEISIESKNEPVEQISGMPDIEGFKKLRDYMSSTSTSNFEGKKQKYFIKTKIYHPLKEGKFRIPDFVLEINGKKYEQKGFTINVGAFDESKDELFDPSELHISKPDTLIELQEKAFLSLATDKKEIFVGEGVNITLALYVDETNRVEMDWWELGRQVEEISRRLKPQNCWEENFEISELSSVKLQINGKYYYQFLLYQASFFPLNTENLYFPKIALKMLVAKPQLASDSATVENQNTMNLKTFYSNSEAIAVKSLPEHPLKDKVAVGNYYLRENYPNGVQITGQNFNYDFVIFGEGNISAINEPMIYEHPAFDFYPANTKQYINRGQNRVTGRKTFSYPIVPQSAGEYAFSNYFEWIFFNPITQRYDTLSPQGVLDVAGENVRNADILANELTAFYKGVNTEDDTLIDLKKSNKYLIIIEILLFILLAFSLTLIFRKP